MIKSLGQIMLYVRDQEASANFWERAGFQRVEKINSPDGGHVYVVAPLKASEVQLVLQDKTKVEKLEPELHLGTPSIMMQTDNLEEVYEHFVANGIKANPIIELSGFRFFNFSDNEDNYFAIQELKNQ